MKRLLAIALLLPALALAQTKVGGQTVASTGAATVGTGNGVTDDAPAIQTAVNAAVAAGGGDIYLHRGTILLKSKITVTGSNVHIIGQGMGQTNVVMDTSMTSSTSGAFEFYNSTVGSNLPLTVNGHIDDRIVAISAGNAATLAAGDHVLVRSLRIADSASTSKFIGEIHKVKSVDATVGEVTLTSGLGESYLTSDSASLLKVTMLQNESLSDLTVSHAAASAPSITYGAVTMRFCQNCRIERVHIHDVFYTGIDFYSCLDSTIEASRIEDVRSSSSLTVYYGVWVASASRNVAVRNNFFARLRHSVTTGTHSSSVGAFSTNGNEGVQRNVLIEGNESYASTTAHYDTHQPAEGVSFLNNQAYGNWPEGAPDSTQWNSAVYGIQARSDKTVINGNTIEYTTGGILIFAAESKDVVISANVIRDIQQPNNTTYLTAQATNGQTTLAVKDATGFPSSGWGYVFVNGSDTAMSVNYSSLTGTTQVNLAGTVNAGPIQPGARFTVFQAGGHGIVFDSAATGTGFLVDGNILVNIAGGGIVGNGNQTGVVVKNNVIKNFSTGTLNYLISDNAYAAIKFGSAGGAIDVTHNRIQDCSKSVAPVDISGSDGHRIAFNNFVNLSRYNPGWAGDTTLVMDNVGYRPGNTSSPWITSGAVLRANVGASGTTDPVSGTAYTVGSGRCTVLVFGGTVTQIAVDSNAVTGVTSGVFKLAPGETIKITHSVPPTTRVIWD